jgi:hypothetical protein
MAQPAENAAVVQPRPEPEKFQEEGALVETPSIPERRPRVALLPPSNATSASPRPEPAKADTDTISAATPSLPGRSPFRQAPGKSEIVENGSNTAATFGQQTLEPVSPKGTAASRFLANLWPGNKGADTSGSSTAPQAGPSSAGEPEAGEKTEKPPIKRLLDGMQFWKK